MRKTDLAYVAGIVDGEGCITLSRSGVRGGGSLSLSLIVTVTNTNIWIIEWLRFAFEGKVIVNKDRGINRKPVYTWLLSSLSALEFLRLIYPYLRLKKPQAEIAIRFLEMRGQKGRRFTPEEQTKGESLRIQMSKLNKRGIK